MTNEKKGPGAPPKADKNKNRRRNVMLPPDVDDRLQEFGDYKRSKVVTNALKLYFKVLDGEVSIVTDNVNPDSGIQDLLHS